MTLKAAKDIFAKAMKIARQRSLTATEKKLLAKSQAVIRSHAKPAMNRKAVRTVHGTARDKGERGSDYGQPRQTMRGKRFEPGDRVRFKSDKSLGTVTRAGAHSLTVRDDAGDSWQVTTADIIHSSAVKVGKLPNESRKKMHPYMRMKLTEIVKSPSKYASTAQILLRFATLSQAEENEAKRIIVAYDKERLKPNSTKGVLIYGRCLRIEAIKTTSHTYGGKRTAAGQKYYHDFTSKNAKIYGLPNGDLLISTR